MIRNKWTAASTHVVCHEDKHEEEREEHLSAIQNRPADAHACRNASPKNHNQSATPHNGYFGDSNAPLSALGSPHASQQSRLLGIDFRGAATTHRPPARLALALRAERRGDLRVRDLLRLAQPLVQHAERDDGEAREDKGVRRRDVPRPKHDARILDLRVPACCVSRGLSARRVELDIPEHIHGTSLHRHLVPGHFVCAVVSVVHLALL